MPNNKTENQLDLKFQEFMTMSAEDLKSYHDSFKMILRKLATRFPNKRFGFPYIGMGLAGGDKGLITELLERFARQITETGGSVTLVEFNNGL